MTPWRTWIGAGLALVTLAGVGASEARAAESPQVDGLEWAWTEGTHRRWFVEAEVSLPAAMWFLTERQVDARLIGYQMQVVVDCEVASDRGKGQELACQIEDFTMRGAAARADRGLLQEVLEEVDDKLTGARIQIIQRDDGRVTSVDLEEVRRGDVNRRTLGMEENIRLTVARVVAGMDLRLPKKGVAESGVWPQYDAMLMLAPSSAGAYASSQIAHRVIEVRDGDQVVIESAGRGVLSTAESEDNFYDTELRSMAVFDVTRGELRERLWSVYGEPTAGSEASEGYRGIPYVQWGRLRALEPGELVQLDATAEISPPGEEVPTLQMWEPMGIDPTAQLGGRGGF